jgi:hypothetical protein
LGITISTTSELPPNGKIEYSERTKQNVETNEQADEAEEEAERTRKTK